MGGRKHSEVGLLSMTTVWVDWKAVIRELKSCITEGVTGRLVADSPGRRRMWYCGAVL